MTRFTQEEYELTKLKLAKFKRPYPPRFEEDNIPDSGPESELAKNICAHAKSQGWPYIYFPQSEMVRFFLPAGWPDFVIAIPQGRTIYLETKSAKGELRKKQTLMANMFRYLGHEYEKCKSFKRYLKIVERKAE